MSDIPKHPGGRPVKYETKDQLQEAIDKYFNDCKGEFLKDNDGNVILNKYQEPIIINAKPLTMTGLSIALGITRETLSQYRKQDKFSDAIISAREKVQEYAEQRLFDKDGANGAKFTLAANFGWEARSFVDSKIQVAGVEEVVKAISGDEF